MTEICNRHESLRSYQKEIGDIFRHHDDCLIRIRKLAVLIADNIEELGAFTQRHTAVLCPECTSVCCINRHSYQTVDDIIFIYAIGEKVPSHDPAVEDSGPCQFLGRQGCTLARSLRPYRCNWYFCAPLLADITSNNSNPDYRLFISLLKDITGKRQRMIEEYASAVKIIAR